MKKKTVLVTGGAQRLGAEICTVFASDGWRVWCHYRTAHGPAHRLCAQLADKGYTATPIAADLASDVQRADMMQTIAQTTGALNCLVNNASLFLADTGSDFQVKQASEQLLVNLLVPLSLAQTMAAQERKGALMELDASVIHILDQKVFNLNPDYFSYTVAKLALERAVALQAQALAPHVRVCGVAPGLMYPSGPQSNDNFALAAKANLRRQAIAPADVAKTCLFLASTPSITGTTFCVDNGQHLVPLPRDIMFVTETLLQK